MEALPRRTGDDRFAGEQAALRRVATLVARAAAPEEVFGAVTEEAGRLLHADHATMGRYDPYGTVSVVAGWDCTGAAVPVGSRVALAGRNLATLVFHTGRAARIDDHAGASGPVAEAYREFGVRASVGVPVSVEGELWGVMIVDSRAGPLPAGTEERLAGFTELAAVAIANAQAHVELRRFAEEQAALRRVATLVAQGTSPHEVFASVTGEAGRLLEADHAEMGRYGPDGTICVVATWGSADVAIPVGTQHRLGGHNLHTMIFRTRQPARIDDPADISEFGIRGAVGVPIS